MRGCRARASSPGRRQDIDRVGRPIGPALPPPISPGAPPKWRQITKRTAYSLVPAPVLALALGDWYGLVGSLPLAVTSVLYHEQLWCGAQKKTFRAVDRLAIVWGTALYYGRYGGSRAAKRFQVLMWWGAVGAYALSYRHHYFHGVCHIIAATASLYMIARGARAAP